MERKIKLGISTCLLGENVRFDGGHKLDRFLTDTLGQYVEYVPVCPEVECGLPVPRESMHLEGDPDSPRLVTSRTKQDMTEKMVNWARRRVDELEKEGLMGFIFEERFTEQRHGARPRLQRERDASQKGSGDVCQGLHGALPAAPRGR